MTLRAHLARLAAVGAAIAVLLSLTSLRGAGIAAAQSPRTETAAAAATAKAFSGCPLEYICDYVYDNGYDICFKFSPFSTPGNIPNWARYGCRNVDGAIYDNSPFTLRVYFSPRYGDPHACIKPWTKIRDLFNYDFNSGSGPHDLVIGNDIASSTISLSACTNPI